MTQNLSVLASELSRCARAVEDFLDDPITRHYGAQELAPQVQRQVQQRALAVCRMHGFLTITSAICAIEARTTDKWLYSSGLLGLIPESEDYIV